MLTRKNCDSVAECFYEHGSEEACELFLRLVAQNQPEIVQILVCADSELSAIAHGRPPSPKHVLVDLYPKIRALYERQP